MQEQSWANSLLSIGKRSRHREWVERGFKGEGRIELIDENLANAGRADKVGIIGAELGKIRLIRCNLKNSSFDHSGFSEGELDGCNWNDSEIYGCNFDKAIIKNCNFSNVEFTRTHFIRTKVQGGDWSNSHLELPTWTEARVKDVNFRASRFPKARMYSARFINCDFRDTDLSFAEPFEAYFEQCDFRGANFKNMKLKNTTFKQCAFYGCYDTPEFIGSFVLVQPDLSPDFDGSKLVEQNEIIELWQNNPPAPPIPEPEPEVVELTLEHLVCWSPKTHYIDPDNPKHRALILEATDILIERYIHTAIDLMEGIEGQHNPFDDWDDGVFDDEIEGLEEFSLYWDVYLHNSLPAVEQKPDDEEIEEVLDYIGLEIPDPERRDTFYRYWTAAQASESIIDILHYLTNSVRLNGLDLIEGKVCPPLIEIATQEINHLEQVLANSILPNNVKTHISKIIKELQECIAKMEQEKHDNLPITAQSQELSEDSPKEASKDIELEPQVQESSSLEQQRQEKQEKLELVKTRLAKIDVEKKRLNDRIKNLSGGNYNPSLHSRIKELKAKISKLIGDKSQLEREKADLEQEIERMNQDTSRNTNVSQTD